MLKIDPIEHPHLVLNEAAHLTAAAGLGIPVSEHVVVHDCRGVPGLLVRRFDRKTLPNGCVSRASMEDGAQALGLPPSSKYTMDSEQVVVALAKLTKSPVLA
ncbi:HipA domain-containing protein [Corynebacterium argentoratense]|uniref:HipA domain-containing protein n=1 Tax=Corynebacterium argentoratense TaxID=42817 RepID=UPI003CD0E252